MLRADRAVFGCWSSHCRCADSCAINGASADIASRFGPPLIVLARRSQNPVIGYYDPINLATWDLYGQGEEASIGFLRHGACLLPATSTAAATTAATAAAIATAAVAAAAAAAASGGSSRRSSTGSVAGSMPFSRRCTPQAYRFASALVFCLSRS
jgi:hypothetical protein